MHPIEESTRGEVELGSLVVGCEEIELTTGTRLNSYSRVNLHINSLRWDGSNSQPAVSRNHAKICFLEKAASLWVACW